MPRAIVVGKIGRKNVAQLVQLTTNLPHCFSGTLCLFDGADAFIRSGGGENAVDLFSRLNYVAWARFVGLGIRELAIRGSLERVIETVKASREAIASYTENSGSWILKGSRNRRK